MSATRGQIAAVGRSLVLWADQSLNITWQIKDSADRYNRLMPGAGDEKPCEYQQGT